MSVIGTSERGLNENEDEGGVGAMLSHPKAMKTGNVSFGHMKKVTKSKDGCRKKRSAIR